LPAAVQLPHVAEEVPNKQNYGAVHSAEHLKAHATDSKELTTLASVPRFVYPEVVQAAQAYVTVPTAVVVSLQNSLVGQALEASHTKGV
jgi:hypothetical protein